MRHATRAPPAPPSLTPALSALSQTLKWMEEGKEVRHGEWSLVEIEVLNRYQLLTAKPVIYLVNLSEKDYIRKSNKFLPLLADWLKVRGRRQGDTRRE